MALEKHGFFNGTSGDPREYDSADLATAFRILSYLGGVSQLGTNLQVTAEGGTMKTLVGYGTAMLSGYWYELLDDGGDVMSFTHTTSGGLSRIDRIVFRLNLTTRTITLAKLIGVEASTPIAPTLTWSSEIQEGSLAQILIRAGATEILASDITDERPDDVVCGIIAPASMRPSNIIQYINENTVDVLRYIVQTFTTNQKAQLRANMNAAFADDVRTKLYTALTDIGLVSSTTITLQEVFAAMPDDSVLTFSPDSSATSNVSPSDSRLGLLRLTRDSTARCRAEFFPKNDATIWMANAYYDSSWVIGTWQQFSAVVEISGTLTAAGWTGAAAPYAQNVSVAGMTATKKGVSVGLSDAATDDQFEAALEAVLRPVGQGTNYVTVKAYGEKPTINIPVLIQIVG